MRKIIKTHTGIIVSDSDLMLEYLYTGDYGKENNVKADFLGYTKCIDEVKGNVNLEKKLVITVSSQKGCPMNCNFCDCPKLGFHGNCSRIELVSEITSAIAFSGIKHGRKLNLHFARMGEPTFVPGVIDAAKDVAMMIKPGNEISFDIYHPVIATMMPKGNPNLESFLNRWIETGFECGGDEGFGLQFSINTLDETERNKMFRGFSRSLSEIGDIISRLPAPRKRKYTLNFAVAPSSNLDPTIMSKYFDKDRCVVKITPVHETYEAVKQGYRTIGNFDIYEYFEKPLVKNGWDVIVSLSSKQEDSDRITCGNSLIAQEAKNED